MNAKEMAKFKKHLEDKRIELLARVRAARENEAEGASENAADLGDRALSTVTRDLSYRLSTGERDILKRIDAALDRFYGASGESVVSEIASTGEPGSSV